MLVAAGSSAARGVESSTPAHKAVPAPSFVSVCAADLAPKHVEWLVPGTIPIGAITVLGGNPGLGKSLYTINLVAQLTAGRLTATAEQAVLLTAEDSREHVVLPRLMLAGADLNRVHFPPAREGDYDDRLMLPDRVNDLAALVKGTRARLVVVDPLVSHLSGKIDPFKDQKLRLALAPLAAMAEDTGCSVLLVSHLNKSQSTDPLIRLGGSVGLTAAARSVLLLGDDPTQPAGDQSRRVLAHVKTNFGKPAESEAWRIRSGAVNGAGGPNFETAQIVRVGASGLSGRDLLQPIDSSSTPSARQEAIEFLHAVLADDPMLVKEIQQAASEAGLSFDTVKKAKHEAGVATSKMPGVANGPWTWWLLPKPKDPQAA